MNSSSKRLQIGGENLEHGEKCRTFALSKDLMAKRDVGHPMQLAAIESNTMKDAIKREQSDARISSAEREHLRW